MAKAGVVFTKDNHNLRGHPLYNVWNNMKQRCGNPNVRTYKWYGAKGVCVCDDWKNNFRHFYEWAIANGWKNGMSIERIDIDKDYSPENCTLIPIKRQARNRKTTYWVNYRGRKMSLAECVEKYSSIKYYRVWQRITRDGYSLEEALSKPVRNRRNV